MLVEIKNHKYLPDGLYALMNEEKTARAKAALSANANDEAVLIEYDKLGGLIINQSTGEKLPVHTLWNLEKIKMSESVENLSNDELLAIIREGTNTDVPGSRYQKASKEWEIRHQQAMLETAKTTQGSSFVSIAPGAKVKGLKMTGNKMVGRGQFLKNEGELENATLKRNQHFASSTSSSEKWYTKPIGIIATGIFIGLVVAGVAAYLGWN